MKDFVILSYGKNPKGRPIRSLIKADSMQEALQIALRDRIIPAGTFYEIREFKK